MPRYKKTNKGMLQLAVRAFMAAVIGALLVFTLFKWTQKPVTESELVTAVPPAAIRLVTSQSGKSLAVQAPLPEVEPIDLEVLVAPIALYPDLLLAQFLPASTYPLEVVQAARWLESKPDLKQASDQDWALSIIALLQFPQVIFMMNDRLDWSAELGDRFLAEPGSVLAAIQSMRARAMTAGLLKNSPEQKVTKTVVVKVSIDNQRGQGASVEVPAASKVARTERIEVIRIEPANSQMIYVPQYKPQLLYKAPSPPPFSPDANSAPSYDSTPSSASAGLTYGAGVATDALLGWAIFEWSDDNWDDNRHRYYRQPHIARYSGNYNGYAGTTKHFNIYRDVNISDNKINGIRENALNRPVARPWVHDPLHRRGYRYPPQLLQHLVTSEQQPALAGQRHVAGQVANSDYFGYEQNKLARMRQAQVDFAASGLLEAGSVFSGVREGSQAQTFSKRGQISRAE